MHNSEATHLRSVPRLHQLLEPHELREAAGLLLVPSCYVQPLRCPLVQAQPAVAGRQRTSVFAAPLWLGKLVGSTEELLGRRPAARLEAVGGAVPQHAVHLRQHLPVAVQGGRHVVGAEGL